MYALGGRFRAGFGRDTVLKAVGELGSLKPWAERPQAHRPRPQRPEPRQRPRRAPTPTRGEATRTRHPPVQVHPLPPRSVRREPSRAIPSPAGIRQPFPRLRVCLSRGPQPFNYRFGVRSGSTTPSPRSSAPRGPPPSALLLAASSPRALRWNTRRRCGEGSVARLRPVAVPGATRRCRSCRASPWVRWWVRWRGFRCWTPRGIGRRDEWKDDTWRRRVCTRRLARSVDRCWITPRWICGTTRGRCSPTRR